MESWGTTQNGSVLGGEIVTEKVRPPTGWAVRGFRLLARSIGLLLFFVLNTFRPVLRVTLGFIAGLALVGGVISFGAAWYQSWSRTPLLASVGMFTTAVACSILLWYYDNRFVEADTAGDSTGSHKVRSSTCRT